MYNITQQMTSNEGAYLEGQVAEMSEARPSLFK